MSGSDLFGNTENQEPDLSNLTAEQAMEALVGEGKKYATAEELALAALHGQAHIVKLESENGELREKAAKAAHVDEILAEVRKTQQPPQGGNEGGDNHQETDPTKGQQSNTEDVSTIVQKAIDERDKASRIAANKQRVKDELAQKLGAKAADAYRAAAQRTGLNLDELAGSSPTAVLELVMGKTDQPNSAPHSPAGGQRHSTTTSEPNPLSKKAIQARYDKGEISLTDKHKLEFQGLTSMGPEEFYK